MRVYNEKELGKALKNEQDTIEIEGDLVTKVIRIKATGNIAWLVAIAAIAVAFYTIMSTPVTATNPVTGVANFALTTTMATASIATIGFTATYSAIAIAIAAGGVGYLNKLRKYKILEKTKKKLILKKR